MNVVTYEPWTVLRKFREDVDRLFNEGQTPAMGNGDTSNVVTSRWAPAVDIKEEQDRFLIRADVPGVDPKDIEITMENGILTIRGERRTDATEENDTYKRVERVYGSFYRRFSLPDTADAEQITAAGSNGVLEIAIPKQAKVQPRRITVNG